MANNTGRHRRLLALFGAAAIAVAACGGGDGGGTTTAPGSAPPAGTSPAPGGSGAPGTGFACENIGGEVSVVGSWSGSEQDSFTAMIEPWQECSGATVNYTGSRDLAAQLTTGIAGGNLPDLAGLPGPGLMKTWYDQGALKPLDFINFDEYAGSAPPGFADTGLADDGKLLGVFFKAAVKGLIWYNPAHFSGEAPATWDELMATDPGDAEALWCIGLESGGASGWPGTDWIEDFVLRQSGPDVYDAWVKGEQTWSSPEIKQAWEAFGDALDAAAGGATGVVNTSFQTGGNGLFSDPPGCLFHHQASFMSDFFKSEGGASDDDFAFFVMPDVNPEFGGAVTTAGDLVGMFNDTPQARSLLQYLLTPDAQAIWAARGGFIAMNKNVPVDTYQDDATRLSAETLANASSAKFDGSDQMPGEMGDAFNRSIVRFAQNQGDLDAILTELDGVQSSAYGS